MRVSWAIAGLLLVGLMGVRAEAQAADIPVAQSTETQGANAGRKLLDEMVTALGGDEWLNRQDWMIEGRVGTFYKGQPHEESPQFEEYYRARPFGERVVLLSYFSTIPGLPGKNHRDLAEVWTTDAGYEVSYKGKTPLPAKDVEEFQRRRLHSLDVVIGEWLKQPGTIVGYEGNGLVGRHLADKVSILTASNDGVELALDEATHLPLSLTFQWRDPVYKDLNTDIEQFDDYHAVQGIQTPYAVTRLHNGDMVLQRFMTKVVYNTKLAPDLFDPDRPLTKKN